MTPAEGLEKILPAWRASLPPELAADIDGFVSRHRDTLVALIGDVMAIGRAKKGLRPRTVTEFAAYQRLAARDLPKDEESDDAVARRLSRRVDKMAEKEPSAEGQQVAAAFGVLFAQMRALAILLHEKQWVAVPLMLRRPVLAIGKRGDDTGPLVLAVLDDRGRVHMRPSADDSPAWKAWQDGLRADLQHAQERASEIRADIGDAARLQRYAMALWARARAEVTAAKKPGKTTRTLEVEDAELAPDAKTKKWRTEANLQAMRLVLSKEPGELTPEDRKILGQYSGWGGLSIESVEKMIPPELVPETFGLIHEYYTPTAIAEAIVEVLCPFLTEVAGNDGVVRALEPSAGIGRLIRAFTPRRCLELEAGGHIKKIEWTAVEFSKVSSTLLGALRPDVDLYPMPFERWARDEAPRYRGTLGLIVSNPPYGERGAMAREDPDEFYKEKRAYAYFMRRALDLLVPGGIGVFLIPAGFLSGNLNRGLREKILKRHHLLGAYRLPSHDLRGRETVPGASVVMDIVFFRSRGGELTEVDEADRGIWEGDYFKEYPGHILGEEDGSFRGDDEAGSARSWRYKVTGDFTGLPPLRPRPLCTACVLTQIAVREEVGAFQTVIARADDDIPGDVDPDLRPALELGRRVGRFLAHLGADEGEKAAQLWPELHGALGSLQRSIGNPWSNKALRELAGKKIASAEHLYLAFEKNGDLTPALRDAPRVEPKFSGQPGDVVAQAEALYRQRRSLTIAELMEFHRAQGGDLDRDAALAALFDAEWNRAGDSWDELLPRDAYLTGNLLWERLDRAEARAKAGDEQARMQARRLLEAIAPAVFDDITDLSPQHGYVPIDLVAGWLSETLNGRYGPLTLERKDGLLQIAGRAYSDKSPGVAPEVLAFLGYYNHDPSLFQPPKEKRDPGEGPMSREERAEKKKNLAERRIALAKKWADSFHAWVAADDDRREQITYAYNRVARGRIVPTFPPEPLEIARWGAQAPKLRAHQIAGARRVLAQRGGLVAFDVGVGKTYTALAIIARARQEGWVRRPVILVPLSLVWKWHDDILCTLPDYRVAVIGSRRRRLTQGARKGTMISEPDSREERAQKWTMLQTGQLDVVILSYTALSKTKMNESVVLDYISKVEAVERSVALRRRSLADKVKTPKDKEKLSERERALLEHGVAAWVEETLALGEGQEYDPGITWDEIGIDMLVVDEAAAFKNLYMPQPREDGVPKFMGSGGEGSERAWQLDFRAAAVRQKTGGAGIVLLTATPAKNSPLEFYNLIQFIDPSAFTSAGIHDPEQFIDRFLKIEYREVLDSTFEVTKKSAVTGFKNLDDLRTIIFTYGEFRTGAEVGLRLPRPVVETITIEMDDEQEAKYDRYVKEIEDILENPSPEGAGQSFAILGIMVRLSMIALHPAADEGYTYKTALEGGSVKRTIYQDGEPYKVTVSLPRPTYESPKLVECARRVAASPHCGHIIFVEPTAVHQWMREVLVEHGIPRERIAILNADATGADDRIRIAREFNGLSSETPAPGTCARPGESAIAPKYDVVIANSVAYEGIDLQVRTCTIHHLDLPWTPSDLEQRNGRAVRQGNTLGTVQIYYYFADASTDGYRFSLIDGKAGWLGELIKSQVRDTNNPAAQQQLTQEDILLMISRNKEKTRALIEDKKKKAAEEARGKIAKEAARLLRQASARFRDARASQDPEKAARLRDEGEQRLEDLQSVTPEAWPWAPWMTAVRDHVMIVPENGGAPVYEGLRVARPRAGAPDEIEFLEFGQVVQGDAGEKIGLRAAGSPGWQLVTYEGTIAGTPIAPEHLPREGGPHWPEDDDARTAAAIEQKLETLRHARFETLGWRGASDAFLERYWPRFAATIADRLSTSFHRESAPVVDEEGLAIATGHEIAGAEILPPTLAGWRRYLELAPKSGESYSTLREAGLQWWGRKIPGNLLSGAKEADEAEGEVESDAGKSAAPVPAAEPSQVTEPATKSPPKASSPTPAASPPALGDRAAAKALVRRLNLMPQGVRLGSIYYGSPTVEAIEGDVEITFQGPVADDGGVPLLVLRATPRDDDVEVRGELQDGNAVVTASFGPVTVKRTELVILRETSLSRWFGVETTPEAKLSPTLRGALMGLRKEHDAAAPDEQLSWPGVDDGTKDRLIARGLAIALENPGGFPHYRLTAKGREVLDAIDAAEAPTSAPSTTGSSVDDRFDQARSELRALRLPAKQHGKFLKQIDAAIATGKSPAAVLARARKAADKLASKGATPARAPEPSTLAAIVDAFNAEPRWRLALERPRPSGYVFGVYPEGRDPSDTVASIEVIDFDIDEARWLSDRLSLADQGEIEARLERALWVGVDVDEKRAEESRSPIEDLIAAIEHRAHELGVDPRRSLRAGRTDGYASIAEALRDLATPVGMAADELERWLESRDYFLAAEVVARSRASAMNLDTLVADLWSAVFDHFTIVKVAGEPGKLRVPRFAVQGQTDRYVLTVDRDGARPRRVFVLVRGEEDDGNTLVVHDPADRLRRGSEVFTGDLDEGLLDDLYKNLSDFEEGLRRAPRTLSDVRLLLYWAAAMLDAPRCQGEVKRASHRAFEEARAYYDAARRQLAEGLTVEAVRRLHAAMRRIGKAAAELAQSCAEGQLPIVGAEPALEVTPEDAAAVGSPNAPDTRPSPAPRPTARAGAVMTSAAMEVFK